MHYKKQNLTLTKMWGCILYKYKLFQDNVRDYIKFLTSMTILALRSTLLQFAPSRMATYTAGLVDYIVSVSTPQWKVVVSMLTVKPVRIQIVTC